MLPPTFYCCCVNGAHIVKVEHGQISRVLSHRPIPTLVLPALLSILKVHTVKCSLYEADVIHETCPKRLKELRAQGLNVKLLPDVMSMLDSPNILKLIVPIAPHKDNREFFDAFEQHKALFGDIETYQLHRKNYEICAHGVSKAAGVALIAKHLGASLQRDVLSFGDDGNDLPMLEQSAFSICPSSSAECALATATKISRWTNDEECVANECIRMFNLSTASA